jgi:hypothetical protein
MICSRNPALVRRDGLFEERGIGQGAGVGEHVGDVLNRTGHVYVDEGGDVVLTDVFCRS